MMDLTRSLMEAQQMVETIRMCIPRQDQYQFFQCTYAYVTLLNRVHDACNLFKGSDTSETDVQMLLQFAHDQTFVKDVTTILDAADCHFLLWKMYPPLAATIGIKSQAAIMKIPSRFLHEFWLFSLRGLIFQQTQFGTPEKKGGIGYMIPQIWIIESEIPQNKPHFFPEKMSSFVCLF